MTDLALPADTVQFYNDGPEFPTTPLLLKAEQAYREGFATTASAAASWKRVDEDMIEEMWRSRRAVRRKAEILVPSAELFDRPDMDSEQIVYRAGHDVEAARARGKVHGLEFARQCWDELEAEGVSKVLIGPLVLAP
ncbi:hypothetical protein CA54_36140 [Symmachiella macrocystis]|uniref:Uncharacterized protein n=1 Tax=Symmachiella macrocystis TaxID=2527985 RepID=A0A5C6BS12_9PLAN|nr:hypothetical protein [Symmachiella macrocystis]TWU14745.1 hypothetical protein CA54_36140 [Symmachiella macrocystis]